MCKICRYFKQTNPYFKDEFDWYVQEGMSARGLILVLQFREFRVDRRTIYKYINECIPEELRQLRKALIQTKKEKKKSKTKFPLKPASQRFSMKDMVIVK